MDETTHEEEKPIPDASTSTNLRTQRERQAVQINDCASYGGIVDSHRIFTTHYY
ncbi:hypothetical protein PIIN_11341 [Serendipita indica DSM 11827]|uniref:Uncharacterized protein n=1 Tax=Serendipita indica (strain DSM 11827) TaxID=1109443 RepID=G4U1C1_SERID|nr:hypothetical protein PIIN_11341 [Serendipita indica DSM 11827]